MNKEKMSILEKIFIEQIIYKDILGEHKGVAHEIKINNKGIFVYAIFFGMQLWLKINPVLLSGKKSNKIELL